MKRLGVKILLLVLFLNIIGKVYGQIFSPPYDQRYEDYMYWELLKDSVLHTSFKPFILTREDWMLFPTFSRYIHGKFWKRLFVKDNFLLESEDLSIHLNLLGQLSKGMYDTSSIDYFRNTRGFEIYGHLGKRVYYYTKFLENQCVFRPYIDSVINRFMVIPGEGWWKPFGKYGRDFTYAMGFLNYQPTHWLEIQLGHNKNFIGSGYRSLLLSDNSFVYPQLKLIFTWKNWRMYTMWTEFYSFHTRYYFYHYSKHGTFDFLSYAQKHFEIGLFEGTIWKTSDYRTYVNHFPVWFFVPWSGAVVYGLDGENNSVVGLDFNVHYKTYMLYGQFVADKLDLSKSLMSSDNRYAYQLGLRSYDVFMGKVPWMSMSFLAEFNLVRPYTYSSVYKYQSYSHYNQSLAEPLGADFKEFVFISQLRIFNLSLRFKHTWALTDQMSDDDNVGRDIFLSPVMWKHRIGQVAPEQIIHNQVVARLVLNAKTMLGIYAMFDRREVKFVSGHKIGNYMELGISTVIANRYYDF